MKQITIVADDRVGLLADISFILGKSKINIEGIGVNVVGPKAVITLEVKDPEKTIQLLKANGYEAHLDTALVLRIPDKPGELAKISQILQKNKISILSVSILTKKEGYVYDCMRVDKPDKAKELLKNYIVEES